MRYHGYTNRRAKRTKNWNSGTLVPHTWCTFHLVMFKVILVSFGALVSKWPITKKTPARRRAKWSAIWDYWILVTPIWGPYVLVVFKVILGAFDTLVSKWPVCQKWLLVERNGVKHESQGQQLYICGVILPCIVQSQFGVIQCTRLKVDSWIIVTNIGVHVTL